MSVIYCNYIIDATSLCELVSVSDFGGLNVDYLQISRALSEQQLIANSQYFVHKKLSCNLSDWCERLSEGSTHFKYLEVI